MRRAHPLAAIVLLCALAPAIRAQDPAAGPDAPPLPAAPALATAAAQEPDGAPSKPQIETERAELQTRMRALAGDDGTDARAELELLRALDGALARVIAARGARAGVEGALEEARKREKSAPAERVGAPPYGFAQLDATLAADEQQRGRVAELARTSGDAKQGLASAERRLQDAERERRLAKEELERASPADRASELERRELRSQVAAAEVSAWRSELLVAERASDLEQSKAVALEADLAWIRDRFRPSSEEAQARLDELAARVQKLERYREGAERAVSRFEREIVAARKAAERMPAPTQAQQAQLRALAAELQLQQQRQAILIKQLARAHAEEATWKRRFALASGQAPRRELEDWLQEARERVEQSERELRLSQTRLAELRRELEAARAKPPDAEPDRARWQAREVDARAKLVEVFEREQAELERGVALERSWSGELARATRGFDLASWLARRWDAVRSIWRSEIAVFEDSSITIGKLVTAVLVFALGYLAASLIANRLAGRVLERMRIDPGMAFSYERLVFYGLLVFAFLGALRIVNIPLTAFTVVGGAIAIGVGFGSQNLVSNFISGLILLAEQPIKRGDLIEIDGTGGTVERIGLRSTQVRTAENAYIIMPNSRVLESRLVNYTEPDPTLRTRLRVGVAYGSPTEQVAKLIRQAIDEHEHVLRYPEPVVLFTDFGESALMFQASFTVSLSTGIDRTRIESDLRFRIESLFREAGLVMAFPQRDVHLDTPRPLEVRLVDPRGDAP